MSSQGYSIPQVLRAHYRRVRTPFGQGCGLWGLRLFILPHTLIGAACLFVAMPGSVIWAAFGTDHVARVQRVWTTRTSKGGTSYHADYIYDLPGGQRRTKDAGISAASYERLNRAAAGGRAASAGDGTIRVRSIGAPPIFYDHVVESGGGGPWGVVGSIWLFGLFWNGVLSVFVHLAYIGPWRVRRLYRSGTPVEGRVISKRVSRGKSTAYYVRYAYQTADGDNFDREMTTSREHYEVASHGASVTVLYDPRKPRRSVVYEYGPHYCE
jgi:Protein of unknown function (DUF3592)